MCSTELEFDFTEMDFSAFDPNGSLSILMDKAARAQSYRLQNLFLQAHHDITVEQWMILLLLWKENGQFQQQLADGMCRDKTTLTRQIDGLEKRNIIVRVPDKIDRRHKRIYLTQKGKDLQQELIPLGIENGLCAMRDIPPEHLQICKDVLRKVHKNLSNKK